MRNLPKYDIFFKKIQKKCNKAVSIASIYSEKYAEVLLVRTI
jgi:hypothetical protein